MRIPHRGVGQEHPLLLPHPLRKFIGAHVDEPISHARRRGGELRIFRHHRLVKFLLRDDFPLHIRPAVDDHVAEIRENFCRAITLGSEAEQLRRGVDECRRRIARHEAGMQDEIFEERDVGLDAADAEFAQRPIRSAHRFVERRARRRQLDQQRIEIRRNDRAAEPVAPIQPQPESARRAIGRQPAVIGDELVFGVFRRDARLNRVAAGLDLILPRQMNRRIVQLVALGDENLAADDVDAGDHFRHRVLDLDARVHLDEIEVARLDVQQEFDRAGIDIFGLLAKLDGRVADSLT